MNENNANIELFPYQWELLAAMITYKSSNGLCLDRERITGKDFENINKAYPLLSKDSLYKWFNGRKPKLEILDDLCSYTSDAFPYFTWDELSSNEKNFQIMVLCPSWKEYDKCLKAEPGSQSFVRLQEIKKWAYFRVITLAKRSWSPSNYRFQDQLSALMEYEGDYKLFMPGQIPPVNFKPVYVNPFEIKSDGEVLMTNGYTGKIFSGYATVRESDILQVILYPIKSNIIEGFEYTICIKLNKYGSTASHFPGIILGFNGEGQICSYPVLLTADNNQNVDSPLVTSYFNHYTEKLVKKVKTIRLDCLSPLDILSLIGNLN